METRSRTHPWQNTIESELDSLEGRIETLEEDLEELERKFDSKYSQLEFICYLIVLMLFFFVAYTIKFN